MCQDGSHVLSHTKERAVTRDRKEDVPGYLSPHTIRKGTTHPRVYVSLLESGKVRGCPQMMLQGVFSSMLCFNHFPLSKKAKAVLEVPGTNPCPTQMITGINTLLWIAQGCQVECISERQPFGLGSPLLSAYAVYRQIIFI